MAIDFGVQYDKRSFLGSKLQRRWNALHKPSQHRSDQARLARIEKMAAEMEDFSQEEMIDRTREWQKLGAQRTLEIHEIVETAFAMVREASRRTTGLFHYPEQVLAGLALVRGGVAEMATGEGKTLGITLPAYVFALHGKGVHVATVNSYLAQRDHEFTQPIFEYLGLTSTHLPEGKEATPADKRDAYAADITYGTGYEFGFDYLRDQLALLRAPHEGPRERLRHALLGLETPPSPVVQRSLSYAIIDEVDSVLIDEAGSPLVISEAPPGPNEASHVYHLANDVALTLEENRDFTTEIGTRALNLTSQGFEHVHDIENVPWEFLRRPWQNYILNALRAHHHFHRDVHYVVDDEGKIVIIDEFTGRRFSERTWRDGLHQAVEAKEDVEIRAESDSAASITRQRYFALYDRVCGLTGTAAESAGEFWHFFRMAVEPIPLHKPCIRKIFRPRVFRDEESMYDAVVESVAKRHASGQPILIGTRTIRASEALAIRLADAGIEHRLLTAKQDEEESEIVANAGRAGNVLLATNMAGRGTHIGLDRDAEAAGGLHVIAVERNESVRIDRQLIGRGARQGEPGSAQVFVSGDDHLVTMHAPELERQMKRAKAKPNGELAPSFSKAFDQVQQKVERKRYEQRLAMAHRDKWLDEIKANLA